MLNLKISETINYVDDASAAEAFALFLQRFKPELKRLIESLNVPAKQLTTVYIHFQFDRRDQRPALKVGRYSTKHKDIDAEITIDAKEFAISDTQRTTLLYERILIALSGIRQRLKVESGLQSLEEGLQARLKNCSGSAASGKGENDSRSGTGKTSKTSKERNEVMVFIEIKEKDLGSFEKILELEEAFHQAIHPNGDVDGHDIGQGLITFFLNAKKPAVVVGAVKTVLTDRRLFTGARVYERRSGSDEKRRVL